MKKSFLLSAYACLALSLAACDKKQDDENGDDPDDGADSTATDDADDNDDENGDSDTGDGAEDPDDGTDGDSDTDDTSVFVDPDTGNGAVECDIWAQDCVDEATKCMPYDHNGNNQWSGTKCFPLSPDAKEVGDTCTVESSGVSGIDDCIEGAMCWDVDPTTLTGVCTAFCIGSPAEPSCADPNKVCAIYNDGVLIVCLDQCDPLLQDCPEDNQCLLNNGRDGFICVTDASQEGQGNPGDPCEGGNACQKGNMCLSAEILPSCTSMYCCSELCDINEPNTCAQMAEGSECLPIWAEGESGPPEWTHVGWCMLPQ